MPVEAELSKLTGVSRTTLRGAIQSLAAKGLVEVGPSRGTRVQPREQWNLLDPDVIGWRLLLGVSADLIRQIYELRECFEPRASYFAAERASDIDHERIWSAFEALRRSRHEDEEIATAADVSFHLAILSSSGNEFITSFGSMMASVLKLSFRAARRRRPLSAEDIQMHRAIAEAILRRSGDDAEASTRRLLVSSKRVQIATAAAAERSTRVARALAVNRTS